MRKFFPFTPKHILHMLGSGLNGLLPYSLAIFGDNGMKRLSIFLNIIGLIFGTSSILCAEGVDNRVNHSAEYIRTLNRNAATDSMDIVVYNPAGVMKMKNGGHVGLSLQYEANEYTNRIAGTDYDQNKPSIMPGLFALYKEDRWAGFAAFTIPAGSGKGNFQSGNASTAIAGQGIINAYPWATAIKNQSVVAESYYYGYTLGGAYEINTTWSLSLGVRYIDAQGAFSGALTTEGSFDFTSEAEYEKSADGWGQIFGLIATPKEGVHIGLRYETKTRLDFHYNVSRDTGSLLLQALEITEDINRRRDLPAVIGLGTSYQVNPNLKVDTSFTYYCNKDADWNGLEQYVDDGYDLGFSFEYAFHDRIKGSFGYLYTDSGIDARYMRKESPQLNTQSLGFGVCYAHRPTRIFNIGLLKVFSGSASYSDSATGLTIEYNKDVWIMAAGFQISF